MTLTGNDDLYVILGDKDAADKFAYLKGHFDNQVVFKKDALELMMEKVKKLRKKYKNLRIARLQIIE